MATFDTETDWQAEALRLRDESDKGTSEVAEIVGKHPATIRKLFARNPIVNPAEDQEDAYNTVSLNGNGHQTDVYDHLPPSEEPPREDDPDPDYDKNAIEAEAGAAVGDMPRDPEPDLLGHEVRVKGTRQLAIDFGPFAQLPSGGTLVLKSEKMASGHFGMGDLLQGTFTARITDVGGKERFDKDLEEYAAKPTAYVATITEVEWAQGMTSETAQEVSEALAMARDAGLSRAVELIGRLLF